MESTVTGNPVQLVINIHSAIFQLFKLMWARNRRSAPGLASLLVMFCAGAIGNTQTALPPLSAPASFITSAPSQPLAIHGEAVASRPFSVVGPRGAILGQQDGSFELWLFPWKVLSHLRISVQMENYAVPIDVNQHASEIEVRPDSTTITYSHANFTIRQVMLTPRRADEGTGAIVLFQIDAVRPMTLTFSFTPDLQKMWPAASDDHPSPEWVDAGGASGFYVLHLNFPDHAAAIAMPTAQPGWMLPYQERAASYPLQFVLHFDPKHDAQKLFPLLVALGNDAATSTTAALARQIGKIDSSLQSTYEDNQADWKNMLDSRMSIVTPDNRLNAAFSWAEVSMEQLRVETVPGHKEEGLTAGFIGSGDSVRPGFGWYFGRDALWTIYALNSVGSYESTRKAIEFLLKRQSPEGKILHEWSQTADEVDWKILPYAYRAADSTPLLPMAMNDYLRISGDKEFIAAHWEQLARAWKFECSRDVDGDGIYDNSEGTAWVESWVPKMPQQEIYLAVLDEQAALAFASLARETGHSEDARKATQRASALRLKIEKEYYLPAEDNYAFSWNGSEGADTTPTIFPAVAWWDGDYALDHNKAMFSRWASAEFSTDWGTRLLGDKVSFYDPISYHQGSVWPLFTGWTSVAEYRNGHTLSAYAHLMQNANLTWSQDLGHVTELLSGKYFQPLGRSTANQLWSASMVVSPVVRGMFGLAWDLPNHSLSVTPNLPAGWESATVRKIPFGATQLDLKITRHGTELVVEPVHAPAGFQLTSLTPGAHWSENALRIPLPDVEVAINSELPEFGAVTQQLKVLDQLNFAHHITLKLSGEGGASYSLQLRENADNLNVRAEGAELSGLKEGLRTITVAFPNVPGYVTKTVELSW